MQDVELDRGHSVQIAFDHRHRHPMAGYIEQKTTPEKARLIFDVDGLHFEAVRAGRDQLREGLQSPQRSGHGSSLEARVRGRHIQLVGFVFTQGWVFTAPLPALYRQRSILPSFQRDSRLPCDAPCQPVQGRLEAGIRPGGRRNAEVRINGELPGSKNGLPRRGHKPGNDQQGCKDGAHSSR